MRVFEISQGGKKEKGRRKKTWRSAGHSVVNESHNSQAPSKLNKKLTGIKQENDTQYSSISKCSWVGVYNTSCSARAKIERKERLVSHQTATHI